MGWGWVRWGYALFSPLLAEQRIEVFVGWQTEFDGAAVLGVRLDVVGWAQDHQDAGEVIVTFRSGVVQGNRALGSLQCPLRISEAEIGGAQSEWHRGEGGLFLGERFQDIQGILVIARRALRHPDQEAGEHVVGTQAQCFQQKEPGVIGFALAQQG